MQWVLFAIVGFINIAVVPTEEEVEIQKSRSQYIGEKLIDRVSDDVIRDLPSERDKIEIIAYPKYGGKKIDKKRAAQTAAKAVLTGEVDGNNNTHTGTGSISSASGVPAGSLTATEVTVSKGDKGEVEEVVNPINLSNSGV